jgi:hypothetical protein
MLLKKGLQFETSHDASCWASAADRSKLLWAKQYGHSFFSTFSSPWITSFHTWSAQGSHAAVYMLHASCCCCRLLQDCLKAGLIVQQSMKL